MCKKWGYYVRSVCALFCIFCMLFLSTLQVSARPVNNNQFGWSGQLVLADTNYVFYDSDITIEPTYNYTDFNGGTYSGTSSSSLSGEMTVNETFATTGGNVINISGTYQEAISGRGSWSGSSTMSGGKLYGSVTGSVKAGTNSQNVMTTSGNDSGTISLSTTHGGSTIMHFEIPIFVGATSSDNIQLDTDKYYQVYCSLTSPVVTGTGNTYVSNVLLKTSKGEVVTGLNNSAYQDNIIFMLGSDLLTYRSYRYGFNAYYCFDLTCPSIDNQITKHIKQTGSYQIKEVSDTYQSSIGESSDPLTHQKLDNLNATETDTNTTTHSIFDSISAFFSTFFSNLIGVFVPEDGYFTTWFNNLNQLLTDKLGILYYPFSVIINFFNRCTTAFSSQGSGTDIVFPAIEFTNASTGETYTFLQAQHINLADYNVTTTASANSSLVGSSGFGSLVDIIRTFNAFVILFCLLSLLRTKLNLILRGDNNDN